MQLPTRRSAVILIGWLCFVGGGVISAPIYHERDRCALSTRNLVFGYELGGVFPAGVRLDPSSRGETNWPSTRSVWLVLTSSSSLAVSNWFHTVRLSRIRIIWFPWGRCATQEVGDTVTENHIECLPQHT